MEINILVEEGIEPGIDTSWLQHVVEETLLSENVPPNVEISLVLVGQERIRELNREYRQMDQPTDVLSFSMAEQKAEESPLTFIGPPDGLIHLGEVIISYHQAQTQAEEARHSVRKEITELAVHGILHVLGYDHEKGSQKEVMNGREKEILAGPLKEIE